LLGDLVPASDDDPNTLLGLRYLCRGKSVLLVGPTGIGKSVVAMQMAIEFGLGRVSFGIRPSGKLTSLIIQAENDDGDLCEMRDGIYTGLDLTAEDIVEANKSVRVVLEDEAQGVKFIARLSALLELHKPDLLWIDPLFAYVGGEVSSQEVMTRFCRNQINPLIRKYNCGVIILHHVNKPAGGRDKPEWKAGDLAYLGSGSGELPNWARAVLAIRNIGSHDVFELVAGKRGKRLGWCDEDGQPAFSRHIAHGHGSIYWRDASPDEIPEAKSSKLEPKTFDEFLAIVPRTPERIEKNALVELGQKRKFGKDHTRDHIKRGLASGVLIETEDPRAKVRAALFISRI
jgi:hypothetical protein